MTFKEIYNEEKTRAAGQRPNAWLQRIALAALVSTETVYQWATGWRNPSKPAAMLVAQELGSTAAELFPPKKKGENQ